MISRPDITIVNQIYESANSFVYRGIINKNQQPVIVKLLKEDCPTPAELYRYQQEYQITRRLNLEETIKAYDAKIREHTSHVVGGFWKKVLKNPAFGLPLCFTKLSPPSHPNHRCLRQSSSKKCHSPRYQSISQGLGE
jgi:serine/threonine protein kinase